MATVDEDMSEGREALESQVKQHQSATNLINSVLQRDMGGQEESVKELVEPQDIDRTLVHTSGTPIASVCLCLPARSVKEWES